jgi:hypothetical protein
MGSTNKYGENSLKIYYYNLKKDIHTSTFWNYPCVGEYTTGRAILGTFMTCM